MALWDGSLPRGLVVPAPRAPKQPSQTELNALEEQRQQAEAQQLELFIQDFLDRTRNSQEWSSGTVEGKEEMLADWEQNVWPTWAAQRFGTDTATANYTLNSITQALRRDIRTQEDERDTFGNTIYNIGQSVMQGADQLYDMTVGGIPALVDMWTADSAEDEYRRAVHAHNTLRAQIEMAEATGNPIAEQLRREMDQSAARVSAAAVALEEERAELGASLAEYQSMVAKSEQNERERQAANPQRREDYLRQQEILARDPEAWETLEYIAENPRYLLNLLAQQLPNVAVSVASGGITGAAARTAVGAAVRSGLSNATRQGLIRAAAGSGLVASETTLGVTDAASGIIDEIYSIPTDVLQEHPAYKELAARGYDLDSTRALMAAEAVSEAIPTAAGISAITGIIGPESSLVKPLLGLTSRTGAVQAAIREGALSAASEFVQEAGTQYAQNVGMEEFHNVATDKTRDVLESGVTGALVGGPFGAVGGIVTPAEPGAISTATGAPVPVTDTGVPSATQAAPDATISTVAGINTPDTISPVIVPGITENPIYNTAVVDNAQQRLQLTIQMEQAVEAWRDSDTVPVSAQELEPLFVLLDQYEAAGASAADMESRITAIQTGLQLPAGSTLDIATAYEQWRNQTVQSPSQSTDTAAIQGQIEQAVQAQINSLTKRPSRIRALAPMFNTVSQIESVDVAAADSLLTRIEEAVMNLPGDRPVNVRKWYKSYKKEPSRYGTGRAATTISGRGNQTDSGTATDAQTISATAPSGSPSASVGDSGAATGTGVGGAAYTDTGTVAGDIRNVESVGSGGDTGADSGRSGSLPVTAGPGTDTGTGSPTGAPVERAGDDGRTTAPDGRAAARTTPITEVDLEQLNPEQLRVYLHTTLVDAGRPIEQAAREAVILFKIIDNIGAFTGETRAQILKRLRFGSSTGTPPQSSVDTVRQQYEGTDQWMKAPNGRPTNLTEQQWLQVRTPEFKAWFGDWENDPANASQVVDDNGEPKVVYHGASHAGYDVFKTTGLGKTEGTGAWFTSSRDNAVTYSGRDRPVGISKVDGELRVDEGPGIYAVFLNIREPVEYTAEGRNWNNIRRIDIYDNEEEVHIYTDLNGNTFAFKNEDAAWDYIESELKDENHDRYTVEAEYFSTDDFVRMVRNGEWDTTSDTDGVIIYDVTDNGPRAVYVGTANNYIIFNPEQIKSATDNVGTFDPANPGILYQDSARGGISFLDDGITQILFGDTADASTAIHEFEHLAVNEFLKIVNNPDIAETSEKQQLRDDLYALARYGRVKSPKRNAINPAAWTRAAHERVARAFERYFLAGQAPANSGLDGVFSRMKELLTSLYERAKILFAKKQPLPEDIRAVFDRQLVGYSQETTAVNTVNNTALLPLRNEPQVVLATQDTQANSSLFLAEQNAQDTTLEAEAASEAPDAHDLLNPLVLAVEGANFSDLERIANNNWTAEELAYIESEAELPEDMVWLPPTPMPQPAPQEYTQEAADALVNTFIDTVNAQSISPAKQEIINEDGTTSSSMNPADFSPEQLPVISSIATSIVQRAQHLMQQAQQGVRNIQKQVTAVATMNYSPVWHATRIAKFITGVKRKMLSGASADFQLWCLENLAPTLGDAYQSPAYQAFINAPSRLEGVKTKLMDDVLTPLYTWVEDTAKQIGRDPAELLQAVGKYRTLLHTIEAAPKQEQELIAAVQAAYDLPPDTDSSVQKQRAVARAEAALFQYREFQNGTPNVPRYKVYGGRSIPECNREILELITDYEDAGGIELLDEGNAYLARAIDTAISYLASNGLISETEIQQFGQWMHYVPLTIKYDSSEYNGFDIGPCMPKLNFLRSGSDTPAEDGHAALYNLLNRTVRSLGLQDLAVTMQGAYKSLMQRSGRNIEYTSKFKGDIVFANGLAVVRADILQTLADPATNQNPSVREAAERYLKQSPMWLRLPRTNADGQTVVTPYIILFDSETHDNINKAFVHLYANEDPIPILSKLGRVTGGVAQIYTKARPLFPPINAARDTIERISYMSSRTYRREDGQTISGARIAAQTLLFLSNPANYYRIARFQFTGTSGSSYWDAYFNDFAYAGLEGGVDYDRHMIEATRTITDATIDNMKRGGVWQQLSHKTRQAFRRTYGTYCHTLYSLPAVAQFVTMRRNKVGVRDSAFATTELMNLRQRGAYTTVLSAFFPFTHSISQTAGNMLHFLGLNPIALSNHPKGAQARRKAMLNWGIMAATIMGTKTLIPMIAASLANRDDEEGYNTLDSIPLESMQAALPLGIAGEKPGSYIKIPTGFGPIGLAAQFAIGWDRVERGRMSPQDFAFSTLFSLAKTLIPNSAPAYEFEENPAAFVVSTFAPFLVQPIVQSAVNTAYSGATIDYTRRPEQRASDTFRPTTPEIWQELATTIYDATNGTVDVTPESIRHLVNGYCGGALQIIPAMLEAGTQQTNTLHPSVRQALGPLYSAIGATIVYNPQMNVDQTMFYNALDYYNDRIKAAGIYSQFTQNRPKGWEVVDWRAEVMRRAGFTPEEIYDYRLLYTATQKTLRNQNENLREAVGPLIGATERTEDEVRQAYLRWATDRQATLSDVLSQLNYYRKGYHPQYEVPDERSTEMLRMNAF